MKMVTTSPWKDIDEKFCLCSICLEQLKEPKLLPCLHRFCKNCLDTLLTSSIDVLNCPECREEVLIPPNGADGFKTDFYMKNLVEYVQIQQSLQSEETRECYSCSSIRRAAAYCFKCNDFFCTDCYHAHMTNNTLKDHKQHTLSVEDIESKNITPKKLTSMRDAPRCSVHPLKVSELFCGTCDNVQVCMACMFGQHKGHDLHEETELARTKRKLLSEQLELLEKMKTDHKVPATRDIKEKLFENVNNEKKKFQTIYEDEFQREKIELENIKRRLELIQDTKRNKKREVFDSLQREMAREIQEIKKEYGDMYKRKESEINDEFFPREKRLVKKLEKSSKKLEQFDRDKKGLLESIEQQLNEKLQEIETAGAQLQTENQRFENLNVMASNILASENDWTAVQCIPDLLTAAANLMKNLRKRCPELETWTNVEIDYKPSFTRKQFISKKVIAEHAESKVNITFPDSYFTGATRSGHGDLAITGFTKPGYQAFIITVNPSGKIMTPTTLDAPILYPFHFCDFLCQKKVALAYEPNTIGLYNVSNGSYSRKIISDVISSWPLNRNLSCIASDPANNHILVGGSNSRDVYVFDDQLNYLNILKLPEIIKWPKDMCVSDSRLLVCDFLGRKAYITTLQGIEVKMVREVAKPGLGVDDLRPLSVCTDKDGFIYILWDGAQRYLVQYIHDGSQVVWTRKVDGNARVITAVETAEGEEQLYIATHSTQTVYSYGLEEE